MVPGALCLFPEGGRPGKWLKTPAGWARACIWFEKLKELPRYGTLQEYLSILIWMRKQEMDVARTKLLVDSNRKVEHSDLQKSFSHFLDGIYPYRREAMQTAVNEQRDVLQRWVGAGAIHFTPLVETGKGGRVRQEQRIRGAQMQEKAKKLATRAGPVPASKAPKKLGRAYSATKPVKLRVPQK